jgi:hypothetical protein
MLGDECTRFPITPTCKHEKVDENKKYEKNSSPMQISKLITEGSLKYHTAS